MIELRDSPADVVLLRCDAERDEPMGGRAKRVVCFRELTIVSDLRLANSARLHRETPANEENESLTDHYLGYDLDKNREARI